MESVVLPKKQNIYPYKNNAAQSSLLGLGICVVVTVMHCMYSACTFVLVAAWDISRWGDAFPSATDSQQVRLEHSD